jgi:hypothetical protein
VTGTSLAQHLSDMATRAAAAPNPAEALPHLLLPVPALCGGLVAALVRSARPHPVRTAVGDPAVIDTLAQLDTDFGDPVAMQALADAQPVTCGDLSAEWRWQSYPQALVARTPVRSVHAHPVPIEGPEVATLVVYAERAQHWTAESTHRVELLARSIGGLLSLLRSRDELAHTSTALHTSRQISQALGILMATHKITSEQAFDRLRAASQGSHVKLRDVANEVTLTGRLPSIEELERRR